MSPAASFTTCFLLASILSGGALLAAGVSTESPFLPPGGSTPATQKPTESTPIEFRGLVADAEGLRFAVYEPTKQQGAWVRIGEKDAPYKILSYDSAMQAVIVDYEGKRQTLGLKEAKFGAGNVIAAAPAPAAAPQQPGARPPQRVATGDDAKRLEAIRAEVARRRAAREAAAQQQQPGGQVPR
jgi:pyruvate/2-oxoglutarate dehydrogenase complex dihydrolipoamide acyltransferase (E2) component